MNSLNVLQVGIRLLLLSGLVVSCSEDEPGGWRVSEGAGDEVAYGEDSTVVTDGNGQTFVVTGQGEGCVQLGDQCVNLADVDGRYCGDSGAQADVFLDDAGEVVSVVCYPPLDDGRGVEELQVDEEGNLTLPSNQNGAVILFPEDTNGEPILGDITLDGERVVLYGNGADNTVISGDVDLASNNARVRGVTVQGNVHFQSNSNNSSLALCRIEGNLLVDSNGATVASCEVFGDVKVTGNKAALTNIGVQGAWEVDSSALCEGCYSFSDSNDDKWVATAEVGDPINCGN